MIVTSQTFYIKHTNSHKTKLKRHSKLSWQSDIRFFLVLARTRVKKEKKTPKQQEWLSWSQCAFFFFFFLYPGTYTQGIRPLFEPLNQRVCQSQVEQLQGRQLGDARACFQQLLPGQFQQARHHQPNFVQGAGPSVPRHVDHAAVDVHAASLSERSGWGSAAVRDVSRRLFFSPHTKRYNLQGCNFSEFRYSVTNAWTKSEPFWDNKEDADHPYLEVKKKCCTCVFSNEENK